MEDIDRVENMLWQYWNELPEPKPQYTKWFYSYRKNIVSWLFSMEIELKGHVGYIKKRRIHKCQHMKGE